MLKSSVIYGFMSSVLVLLAIRTIVQAQEFEVSPPPVPNGYESLPIVNRFAGSERQRREKIPETYISQSFTARERQWLTHAVILSFSSQRTDCTLKSANAVEARSNWFSTWPSQVKLSPLESLQEVIQRPGIAVYRFWDRNRLRRTDVPMRLFIDRVFKNDVTWSGEAGVGTNIRNEGYQITINMAKFSFVPDGDLSTEEGRRSQLQNVDTSTKMAGVILHEVLHNIGYDHDEVRNGNFNPVEGSVPYVAQWCLVSFGRHGSAKTLIADGGNFLDGSPSWTDPSLYAD